MVGKYGKHTHLFMLLCLGVAHIFQSSISIQLEHKNPAQAKYIMFPCLLFITIRAESGSSCLCMPSPSLPLPTPWIHSLRRCLLRKVFCLRAQLQCELLTNASRQFLGTLRAAQLMPHGECTLHVRNKTQLKINKSVNTQSEPASTRAGPMGSFAIDIDNDKVMRSGTMRNN